MTEGGDDGLGEFDIEAVFGGLLHGNDLDVRLGGWGGDCEVFECWGGSRVDVAFGRGGCSVFEGCHVVGGNCARSAAITLSTVYYGR